MKISAFFCMLHAKPTRTLSIAQLKANASTCLIGDQAENSNEMYFSEQMKNKTKGGVKGKKKNTVG